MLVKTFTYQKRIRRPVMNEYTQAKQKNHVVELALCAMFIAITFVATAMINIRLPIAANGGLVHL